MPANPVLVEVTRGPAVESRHRGAVAVADAAGAIVHARGAVDRPVFPRSAIKPLQAIPLVETGAADALEIDGRELALACASHNGEPAHAALAGAWLERLGLGEGDLECGPHPPLHPPAEAALIRTGRPPTRLHNNCSGKHAGMLATALHMGEPTAGYTRPEHPVQRRIASVLAALAGADPASAPMGVDGCGVPTWALPLDALARAMAKLARPDGLDATRAEACRRIVAAMAAHPFEVAGTGRFCTAAIEAGGGSLTVKTGAEGVYAAALPELGLGVALKIDDGARRAAEVACAAVLRHLGALDAAAWARLAPFAEPDLVDTRGRPIGVVRAADGWRPGRGPDD